MKGKRLISLVTVLVVLLTTVGSNAALAHCDTMDGPVVRDAQKALETGDVNLVLIWVQEKDETEIKEAFQKTLNIRKLGTEARDFADMYFFETLVRIHRSGEGAPYTGLKPAGTDLGPAVPAADRALENGSADALLKFLTDTIQEDVREQFNGVMARKNYSKDDVAAGRDYVRAYVEYVHYIERLYEAAKNPAEGHYIEGASAQEPAEELKIPDTKPEEQTGIREEIRQLKEEVENLKEHLTAQDFW